MYLTEGGSELLAYIGQAENERSYGLGEGPDLQGVLDTAAVSFWMTGLMGGGTAAFNNRAKKRVRSLLDSDNPVMQSRGLSQVQAGIEQQYGPQQAAEWRAQAEATIESGGKLDFDAPIFQAAQEPVQGEGEEQGVLGKALRATAQLEPARENRALAKEGESVETQDGTVSPREIARMEARNRLAGMMTAGIPVDETNPEHAELLYLAQESTPPSPQPLTEQPVRDEPKAGQGEEFRTKAESPEQFQEILSRQKFEREAKELNRLRNIPEKNRTHEQQRRFYELTGGDVERRTAEAQARKKQAARKFEQDRQNFWNKEFEKAERVDWAKAEAGYVELQPSEEKTFERISKEYTRIKGDLTAGKEVSFSDRQRFKKLGGYVMQPKSVQDQLLAEYQQNIKVPGQFEEAKSFPDKPLSYTAKLERAVKGKGTYAFPIQELTSDELFIKDVKDYNRLKNISREKRNPVQQFRFDELTNRLELILSGEYDKVLGIGKKPSQPTKPKPAEPKTGTRVIKKGIGKEGERTTLGTFIPKEFQEAHRDIKKMSTLTSNPDYKKALPRRTERVMNMAA
ncbi:MAG: hypothetical protein D3909_13435, partial [Candidatus Electrothrix sp. ATG1]|nr:hypothetical protein [Candidatus Electrothrix sp. ATG1]